MQVPSPVTSLPLGAETRWHLTPQVPMRPPASPTMSGLCVGGLVVGWEVIDPGGKKPALSQTGPKWFIGDLDGGRQRHSNHHVFSSNVQL